MEEARGVAMVYDPVSRPEAPPASFVSWNRLVSHCMSRCDLESLLFWRIVILVCEADILLALLGLLLLLLIFMTGY